MWKWRPATSTLIHHLKHYTQKQTAGNPNRVQAGIRNSQKMPKAIQIRSCHLGGTTSTSIEFPSWLTIHASAWRESADGQSLAPTVLQCIARETNQGYQPGNAVKRRIKHGLAWSLVPPNRKMR